MMHARLLMAIGACAVVAACGGGGNSSTATPATHPVTTTRKPDAAVKITIVPSTVMHGIHRSPASKKRSPKFIDPNGTSVSLQFNPYNFNNNGQPSAPQTNSGPIPIATYGPTTATVPIYSGYGNIYGVEVYGSQAGGGVAAVLASNQQSYNSYTLDPGTTESVTLTLSLVPAYVLLSTDPTGQSPAYDADDACINVGGQTHTQLFTLIPADANYNYLPQLPASVLQTPPPNGVNGTVTLSNIMGTSDSGGSSTIVATGATWNGYTVYEFIYTPAGNGDQFAPAVSATASTFNPDGGYDYLDGISDPPGNNGNTFSEQVTINPGNCDT